MFLNKNQCNTPVSTVEKMLTGADKKIISSLQILKLTVLLFVCVFFLGGERGERRYSGMLRNVPTMMIKMVQATERRVLQKYWFHHQNKLNLSLKKRFKKGLKIPILFTTNMIKPFIKMYSIPTKSEERQ